MTHEEKMVELRERNDSGDCGRVANELTEYADELHAALEAERAAHAEDRRIIDAALIATRAEVDEQKDLRQSLEAELEAARKVPRIPAALPPGTRFWLPSGVGVIIDEATLRWPDDGGAPFYRLHRWEGPQGQLIDDIGVFAAAPWDVDWISVHAARLAVEEATRAPAQEEKAGQADEGKSDG